MEKLFPSKATIIDTLAFKVHALDIATMLVIAIGLAMDAFSVSIVYGITNGGDGKTNALKMASFFGAFQTKTQTD